MIYLIILQQLLVFAIFVCKLLRNCNLPTVSIEYPFTFKLLHFEYFTPPVASLLLFILSQQLFTDLTKL